MRPRELTLRGFRSYADETRFEFAGRGLVGIVGANGSGKSSILDAISFALYGKTPKVEAATKSLISQRRDALQVELVFEVDGAVWKVVRAIRKSGAAAHTLYRLDDDGEHRIADKAREVTDKVEALLGLDFEAFRRSVLLAQNQFAGFLEAPAERNKVLKGVFGFDRLDAMREVTKGRLAVTGASLQHLAARRASAETDRVQLKARSAALVAAAERARTLEALRESVLQANEALREAEGRVKIAAGEVAAIDELASRVPTHPDTEGLFAAAATAEKAVAEFDATLTGAVDAGAEAVATLEAVLSASGGRKAIQELGDLVAQVNAAREASRRATGRLEALRTDEKAAASTVAEISALVDAAEKSATDAVRAAADAEAAEVKARSAREEAHATDRAHGLRTGLAVGTPCPVCQQAVLTLPPPGKPGKIDAAEATLARSVGEAGAARERNTEAAAALAQVRARLAAAKSRTTEIVASLETITMEVVEADAAVTALQDGITDRLGEGDPQSLLAELRSRITAAEEAERSARAAEAAARRGRDDAEAAVTKSRAALDRLRTDTATLAGRLGVAIEFGEGAAGIAAGLKALRAACVVRRDTAVAARDRAGHETQAAQAARIELLEGAGLAASDNIVEITNSASREATELAAEVKVLERNLAELDVLGDEEKATLASRDLLDRLHGDLAPSKFLEFVLDERRHALADLGGTHLETLTAGRYRFSDDGEFNVIDLAAADQVRTAVSLSGGETFLASLALALALAEIVSREGGRLDAFFLDEGFESLDPEHLDLAMDGIERLVASGPDRLVVVVSHVPALRERFEDLIVLEGDAVTGFTRVVSGAGVTA